MYYNYEYYNSYNIERIENINIWIIISFVLAVAAGIVLYYLFIKINKEKKLNAVGLWFNKILNFKILFSKNLLKILYVISAIFTSLISFGFIGYNFLFFLFLLIVGNIILRIIYEFLVIKILLYKNTVQINKKLKKINL